MRTKIFLYMLFAYIPFITAQVQIYGDIYVAENTSLISGFDIYNEGLLNNNGTLLMQGDWNNSGNYSGNGTIDLCGTETQLINHVNQDVSKLVISGGGEKLLNSNITVNHEIEFDDGLLTPVFGEIFFEDNVSIFILNEGDSYVNGALNIYGNGNKFFPIGKSGNYSPMELLSLSGNNSYITAEAFEPNPYTSVNHSLVRVDDNRYWQINGLYSSAFIALPANDINTMDENNRLVVAQSSLENPTFSSLGASNLSSNYLTEFVISSHSISDDIFTIGEEINRELTIMNIISPNGDGINDMLIISNIEFYPNNEIILFDALGNEIVQLTNYENDYFPADLLEGNYMCVLIIEAENILMKQAITIKK